MSSFKRTLLEKIGSVFFTKVRVVATREIAPRIWRLELVSDSWRGKSYTPGDKLQVVLDDGPRTYSAFNLNPVHGSVSVICYAHGSSPGAQWGPTAKSDDQVVVFGPRGSVDLPKLGASPVFVGDETGLGVARALHDLRGDRARFVFETDDVAMMQQAIKELSLANVIVVLRRSGDGHYSELGDRVLEALKAGPATGVALTGKAPTIQALRTRLKAAAPTVPQRAKAYSAPGKRGLD